MILQALEQYYERKTSGGDNELPLLGYEPNEIGFVVELDASGQPVQIKDVRKLAGKNLVGTIEWVPSTRDRTGKNSWQTAFLLWDHPRYSLGIRKPEENDFEPARKRFASFNSAILELSNDLNEGDLGVTAVLKFLKFLTFEWLDAQVLAQAIYSTNLAVAYQLKGDPCLVCQRPKVKDIVNRKAKLACEGGETCLVTGEKVAISQLHTATPIRGSKATAKIVSFNKDAYFSYVTERSSANKNVQARNAPVGNKAVFSYTTALNHLLRKGSEQTIQVGDASTVFWAEQADPLEENIYSIYGERTYKDDPDKYIEAVKSVLNSVQKGRFSPDRAQKRFYVLGLAQNAARIAIRFWVVDTVENISRRTKQYFDELEIAHSEHESGYLPLFRLLENIAILGKAENIPPNLAGEVMRCILTGSPYPYTLLAATIRRCKAEKQKVNYPRAALIKAYLNRNQRKEEIKVSLDKENTNTAYRLGRLFATLERIQEKAHQDPKTKKIAINSTIRDRYYGAASANPVSVFPTLLKLKNHHLTKIDDLEVKIYFEKQLGEIFSAVPADLPANLSLQDQGRFAVGYYHQRQDFFTKHSKLDQGESE